MHVLFFTSNKKTVQTVKHSNIYISLLLAACFGFCAKLTSGNKNTQTRQQQYNPLD
jgi:hypothetical protein